MDIRLPKRMDGHQPDVLIESKQITIIGTNGAGKSRFCSALVEELGDKAYRISALKALFPSPSSTKPLPGSIDDLFNRMNEANPQIKNNAAFMRYANKETSAKIKESMEKLFKESDEQAAKAACEKEGEGMYSALIMAVTTKSGVQAVFANPNTRPPCGERQFYALRRKFFWILREMKCGDIEPIA